MYDIKEKKSFLYCCKRDQRFETFSQWINSLKNRGLFKGHRSAIATIFLEPNPTSSPIATILRESDYKLYWKKTLLINSIEIIKFFQDKILPGEEICWNCYKRNYGLQSYEVRIFNKVVQDIYLPFLVKAMKRTLNDIINIIRYIFSVEICHGQSTIGFEDVVQIRGTQLVNNEKEHIPFAFIEKNGQIYRRVDCTLILVGVNSIKTIHASKEILIEKVNQQRLIIKEQKELIADLKELGVNSIKTIHASKEILIEKVNQQRLIIKEQKELIADLKERLNQKFENEEEVSNEIANIAHIVSEKFNNKNINISNLHPIFQNLIHIQTGKSKGTRYHPMFLKWAISVFCRSGTTAYNAMKMIMRLPSVSTLKSYINECEQNSGWQDKIASQLLSNLSINNIWGYGRMGFFSHDSFKIQKGLLWNQRKNCYVDYLDFENEMDEYQEFAMQCKREIESTTVENNFKPVLPNKQKYNLATQVHQFVWHSITHNFSFLISYYGINNMTAHNLNNLIFELAAKLEYVGVHTQGSLCDGAGENRTHIKSFDWYASKWTFGDIVEVNFNKNKKSFHMAKILSNNFEKTKFTVTQIDDNNFGSITIDRTFIRTPMPSKIEWKINDMCEFKSPKDNQWYLGKIINCDPIELIVEILEEQWKVLIQYSNNFLRPAYDSQKLSKNYKTINPITGEDWFFISDPTHVFKKLRNNLTKSHTGEKNTREIMFEEKEISWKHIKGVYDHTNKHATAKATKLTKRYIWLTSWSKMRVDLAEHTLLKEVEDALASIEELKEISEGTRIRDWFIRGDKQKLGSKEWISSQCQFDLILSIDGFLGMLEFLFKKYPGSMIQPKRISQDMLEGLFGTIRELGGDSSTHTLKSYGYSLNKYQITALFSTESSHLEICINNYQCSGIWYQDFLATTNLNGSSTQRLVAYLLLQKVIKHTFSRNMTQNNSNIHLSADLHLIPDKIIILEPAEASKFSYIIGWIVYKLTKSDNMTKSHPKFETICAHLKVLNSEQVIYKQDIRSQITNIIPGPDFLNFMYKLELLVLLLFEKHEKLDPNILTYIYDSLLCNLLLLESFITIFNISSQKLYTNDPMNTEKYELKEETKKFLYERIISIYMRRTASLRENLKTMNNDIEKIESKPASIKKFNIPKDPMLGLEKLRTWTHLENIEEEFFKIFLVSELQWLFWAFGDNSKNKRKKNLILLILDHLKKGTPFSREALTKDQIFVY
ncbi:hypothetical protein Glove_26g233 [Diversispora epigaea]|uniref:Agenet domain-containing protein n=1 Tax=Diversispora epigaea TaxID=1348612 RepID=A0A397JJ30_9GLOM|nr:hypothetical protein Glove_26g233 [Diversispora epigaea]